ncbi:hypothetical protein EJ08DRAFT_191141 [Tothia fuscella]|uniref:DNA repair protein rad9 n=1 Tax=Tothia fuscella TaxID=1048955 RepID=A0A9P4NS82_9PEZI|nr:hypothetical protein EJ08DRAFT_191141 [Tothia fuscella]
MVTLNFTLTPEASGRLHDALLSLSRFSDTVSIEARKDTLTLSALNSSKSGYSSFILDENYFSFYEFAPANNNVDGRFTCSILNKALTSVFKSRAVDLKGRDTAIEKCDVSLQDRADEAQCRFIIRMFCGHGVTKTYRLTYEAVEVMRALFDRNTANNRWTIHSKLLKEYVDYFGGKAEQLDIFFEDGKCTFISFTEKIVNSKNQVLKHPLRTAVAANVADFTSFNAQENMHIVISVKDFKSIVAHADTLDTTVGAYYSTPGRPLQFSYSKNGMHCHCTLMTVEDYGQTPAPSAATTAVHSRTTSRAPTIAPAAVQNVRVVAKEMPPPALPNTRKAERKLGQKEPQSKDQEADSDSLFVPQDREDREDRRWDPADYDNEETLGWDASANNEAGFHPTFRDSVSASRSNTTESTKSMPEGLPPTQRISQIKGLGLFD